MNSIHLCVAKVLLLIDINYYCLRWQNICEEIVYHKINIVSCQCGNWNIVICRPLMCIGTETNLKPNFRCFHTRIENSAVLIMMNVYIHICVNVLSQFIIVRLSQTCFFFKFKLNFFFIFFYLSFLIVISNSVNVLFQYWLICANKMC